MTFASLDEGQNEEYSGQEIAKGSFEGGKDCALQLSHLHCKGIKMF